jgi:osmotically-inducible protein OsmY
MIVESKEVSQAACRLRRSPYPGVRNVSCECEQGVVFLRGQVQCYYHKQLAQEAILGAEGVARVVNEVEVVDSPR